MKGTKLLPLPNHEKLAASTFDYQYQYIGYF